jgi:hypothetical protein
MPTRKDEKAAAMYQLYETGLSGEEVAARYGCTAASVLEMFHRRGWKVRPSPTKLMRKRCKPVTLDGIRYTPSKDGYLRRSSQRHLPGEQTLHRALWVKAHGPIPEDSVIEFIDGNRAHCELTNLRLIKKTEQGKPGGCNQHTGSIARRVITPKPCAQCGQMMTPHTDGRFREGYAAFVRRRFCDYWCSRKWLKGRPKRRSATRSWRSEVQPATNRLEQAITTVRESKVFNQRPGRLKQVS